MQQIIDACIATWNSARDDRQALLERHFSADLSYC
ncbi:nuclear transport factor 2 family protein, partial [Burkholderia multivorans]